MTLMFIVINFSFIFFVLIILYFIPHQRLKRKYLALKSERRSKDASPLDVSEVDVSREKKEVKKERIESWQDDNKNTRTHFEKKRKERNDKGKRRDGSDLDSEPPVKKGGKPKGSNGGAWKRPPENQIDKVVHIHLKKCPKCGAGKDKLGKAGGTFEHVMLDLTVGKHNRQLVITKYIIHRSRCKACKKIVNIDFGLLKDCHFGFGFIATVMQSRIESKHSYSKILVEFERWIPYLNKLISITSIINWFKKYGAHLEEFYLECVKKLKEAKYVHADETGLPMKGKNWWLWVITTTFFTLFIPHASRGRKAIEKFFEKFEGVLITDFWGAYNTLTEEQQKCLSHLVKDLKIIVMQGESASQKLEDLLKKDDAQKEDKAKGETVKKKRGRPKKLLEPLSKEEREKIEKKIRHEQQKARQAFAFYQFFKQAWADENNPLSYQAKSELRATKEEAIRQMKQLIEEIEVQGNLSPEIKRLIERMRRFEKYLFTYLQHPGIPPDNNAAERELRPFVIMRKTSYDFKSEEVMDSFTLYLSFLQTCKKHGMDFGKALHLVLLGKITPVLKAIGF
jgi:hypothetical protein